MVSITLSSTSPPPIVPIISSESNEIIILIPKVAGAEPIISVTVTIQNILFSSKASIK